MSDPRSGTVPAVKDGPASGRAAPPARLAGVTVGVPSPPDSARFFERALDFAVDPGDGAWRLVCDGDYGAGPVRPLTLVPGDGLVEVRFETRPGFDRAALAARLGERGTAVRELDGGGLAFADPAGIPLACAPAEDVAPEPPPSSLRPRRLGHLNLKAPRPAEAAAFYMEALGMRLSEQIGDDLWFLRLGSEHHNVGLRPGGAGELHHLGFEVAGWESYGPILDRLAALGHRVEYGPGRHGPGRNLFAYLRDPHSGLRVELFADMAHIDDAEGYEPIRWEAGDRMTKTINRWGPTPPESFLE